MSDSHQRPMLANLLRHGAVVAAFNTAISLLLVATGASRWDFQFVYSQAIGLSIWLLFDLGRYTLKRDPDSGWPQGWRMFLLATVAIAGGFMIGSSLGDLYCQCKPVNRHWTASGDALFRTIAISAGIAYFFYARGRDQFRQRQIAAAQRDIAETQLKLLESQLEPHMLFNTLANLRVLIGMDPARAQAMLDRLIAFLRATLGASRQRLHPLADEFARLGDYLALMQIRMGERLQVTLELPGDLGAVQVPPLLLQPLVENAIKHGLEPQRGAGTLVVRAVREGESLRVTVQDSGLGLSASAAAGADASRTPCSGFGSGFGVEQVRRRLATLYGDAARFTLEAAPTGGTLATVWLPTTPPALFATPPAP